MSTIKSLRPDSRNANKGNPRGAALLEHSLRQYGAGRSILVDRNGNVIAGNKTLEGAASIGLEETIDVETDGTKLVVVRRTDLDIDDPRARELAIADNRASEVGLEWDVEVLRELSEEVDLSGLFFPEELERLLAEVTQEEAAGGKADTGQARKTLAERFGVPPFSVLDARQGYWQERKRAWLGLGIQSELGRGEGVTYGDSPEITEPGLSHYRKKERGLARNTGQDLVKGENPKFWQNSPNALGNIVERVNRGETVTESVLAIAQVGTGTSIFDPVLCELAYRWFCPPEGLVLDPFAGGSVRGIVAATLGRQYLGIDLRAEQIAANEAQADCICGAVRPAWKVGDACDVATIAAREYDFLFSCPPYGDLEVYSDNPADISTLPYAEFLAAYRRIIQESANLLKPNRFACFVVGEIRDSKGFYRGFVPDTIRAFEEAGMQLYNEAVLVTACGSLPIRVGKQFGSYRKLGKTHQNVLVFYNGDIRQIPDIYGECEFSAELPDTESASASF